MNLLVLNRAMVEQVVSIKLLILAGYLFIGLLFYFWFVVGKRIYKIDDSTNGAPLSFRLLILPGTILLWPFLWKTYKSRAK